MPVYEKLTGSYAEVGGLSIAGTDLSSSIAALNQLGTVDATTGAKNAQIKTATVARTETAAKNLFTLPVHAIIDAIFVYSAAASNAATTATLSVGKTGANTQFVNALDVKAAATGAGLTVPNATNLGDVGSSAIQVVGIYAETGTASTSGGPWTVTIFYHM